MRCTRPHRDPRHPRPSHGFSFVEVLVAVILIDTALLAIVQTHALVVRRRNEYRARAAAVASAQARLEQLAGTRCAQSAGQAASANLHEVWSASKSGGVTELVDSVSFGPGARVVLRTRLPC